MSSVLSLSRSTQQQVLRYL